MILYKVMQVQVHTLIRYYVTEKPLTVEVSNSDHLAIVQCSCWKSFCLGVHVDPNVIQVRLTVSSK